MRAFVLLVRLLVRLFVCLFGSGEHHHQGTSQSKDKCRQVVGLLDVCLLIRFFIHFGKI